MVYQLLALTVALSLLQDQKNTVHQQLKVQQLKLSLYTMLMRVSASDPAQNPYWKRDVRRAYPHLSVITQSELSSLLIEHSASQKYVCFFRLSVASIIISYSSSSPANEDASEVPATSERSIDLTEAITSITTAQKVYSESKLPPTIPTPYKRWTPELAPDAPHDQHAYFPMSLYK